jgi:hypothetical protein
MSCGMQHGRGSDFLPLGTKEGTPKPWYGAPYSFLKRKRRRKGRRNEEKEEDEENEEKRRKRISVKYNSSCFTKTLGLCWVRNGHVKIVLVDLV